MTPDYDAARAAFDKAWELACSLWPKVARAPKPRLTFDLKGRAAGMAVQRGPYAAATVRINQLALAQNPARMCARTIPHEIAHVVCDITGLGQSHNLGWQRVDRALGGTGERCYKATDYNLPSARRPPPKYRYKLTSGREIDVSITAHRAIQRNGAARTKDSLELVEARQFVGPVPQSVTKVLTA